jgi:HEPN domain-containing protein
VADHRAAPGSPREWLARAKGDLALAEAPLPPGGFYEDLCFHAQQAAEKALKAIYLDRGWTFPYIHDLEKLLAGLRENGLKPPGAVDQAVLLTTYAFESRYPGLGEPITEGESKRAVELANPVVRWAESVMSDIRHDPA